MAETASRVLVFALVAAASPVALLATAAVLTSRRGRTNGSLYMVGFLLGKSIAFVVALGFGIVAPAIPLFARAFGVGTTAVGLAVSAFAFFRFVSAFSGGTLVERFGGEVPHRISTSVLRAIKDFPQLERLAVARRRKYRRENWQEQ